MINIDLYRDFFLMSIVLALTPGVAILLTIRNTLQYGYSGTLYSILGNSCVVFSYTVIATLTSIYTLRLDPNKLYLVQYAGASYLVYIAFTLWFKNIVFENGKIEKANKILLFKEGVLVALSNPKMIVFYIVIWPSFLDNTKSIAVQGAALTVTLVFWSIISLIVTMFIVTVGRKRYITENRLMFVNKIMSIAFIVIAISIVYKA